MIILKHEIDLKNYEIRTDLIIESIEKNNSNIKTEINNYDNIKVTTIDITKEESKILHKKEGKYITIEFDDVTDYDNKEKVIKIFTKELKNIITNLNLDITDILIVGLGNASSTPDSLGPKVIDNIIITRHLKLINELSSDYKVVSALKPGVMANTGIETKDIISSVVEKTKPSLLVVVDALASSSISRINKSIQITDTGIHPGSGIGNKREEISKETMSIPVIAIGVPTVVESSIIVYDTINYLFKHLSYIKDNPNKNKLVLSRYNYIDKIKDKDLNKEEKKEVLGLIGELSDYDKKDLINEVLNSLNYNLIVTPKEIDFQIEKLAEVISTGVNNYIHNM